MRQLLMWMVFLGGQALAQGETQIAQDLKRLSIEELLEIEVTSVSRKAEPLAQTAAAIQVITREDIRRSGVTTLPELLRLFAGVQVSRFNAGSWAIGVRGLTTNVSNKLLVMIDGRSVYSPWFSGTFWEVQDTILEDIERIEVVRGPGASLWEANAVNGIINVITRSASATKGAFIRVGGGGAEDLAFGSVRWGSDIGARTSYRVFAKYSYRDQMKLPNGADAKDQLRVGRSGFRIDSDLSMADSVTLQGDIYEGKFGILRRPDAVVSGGNVLGSWTRTFSGQSDLKVQLYFDRSHRFVPAQGGEHRATFDADLQHRIQWAGQDLVWGVGYRTSADKTDDAPNLSTRFVPTQRRLSWTNAFIQDEILFAGDRVTLTLGSKFEYDTYSHLQMQPSARVAFRAKPQHTLWTAVSRAVRTPSRFDTDIRFQGGLVRGNPDFKAENVISYEAGYRSALRTGLSVDVSAYYSNYDDLRSLQFQAPAFITRNDLNATMYGGEILVNYDPLESWRLSGSYSRLRKTFSSDPGQSTAPFGANFESNDAGHLWTLRSAVDLPHQVEFDTTGRFVGAIHVGSSTTPAVPRYFALDSRLAWSPSEKIEFEIVGKNLLDPRHQEYPGGHQILRNVYAAVNLHF